MVDYDISDTVDHVCRHEIKGHRTSCVCSLNVSSNWKLVCNPADSPDKVCDSISMEKETIHFLIGFVNTAALVMPMTSD